MLLLTYSLKLVLSFIDCKEQDNFWGHVELVSAVLQVGSLESQGEEEFSFTNFFDLKLESWRYRD